jgi:hypothetical protein
MKFILLSILSSLYAPLYTLLSSPLLSAPLRSSPLLPAPLRSHPQYGPGRRAAAFGTSRVVGVGRPDPAISLSLSLALSLSMPASQPVG